MAAWRWSAHSRRYPPTAPGTGSPWLQPQEENPSTRTQRTRGVVILLVLAVLIPALLLVFRYVVRERIGALIVCVFVAHTAWHWLLERATLLSLVWSAT